MNISLGGKLRGRGKREREEVFLPYILYPCRITYYRRHRFISTCAYRSNSGDMGTKKRAGAY